MPGYPIPDHYLADLRAENAGLRAALAEAERQRDDMHLRIAEAPRVAELEGRIAELYLAQKNKILSAKSVEHDVGTLQGDLSAAREVIARIERESVDDVSRADARAFLERTSTTAPNAEKEAAKERPKSGEDTPTDRRA